MPTKDSVPALSVGDTGSAAHDAATGGASDDTSHALQLHEDAYAGQGNRNSPSVGTDTTQSADTKAPHHWYDGTALMFEGAIDEAVHHPMRVLEYAAGGLAATAAVAVGVALLPELAVVAGVAGIAGAAAGGITLLANAPKWGREMAIVANPDQVDDKTYQAAKNDLLAAGGRGTDLAAGLLGAISPLGVSAIAGTELRIGAATVNEAIPGAPELPQLMAPVDAVPSVPQLPAPEGELMPNPIQQVSAVTGGDAVPVKTDSELIADYFAKGNQVKVLPPGDEQVPTFSPRVRGVDVGPGNSGGYWIRPTTWGGLGHHTAKIY